VFDDETEKGTLLLDIAIQRFLDSSLIDVDVHPNWISVIIKNKVLRLHLPCEVHSAQSKAQRSQATGIFNF